MTGHPTNEGIGAAQAKTGQRGVPLNRGEGRSATMEAFTTKTRSPHNAAGGPNYLYKEVETGLGGDVVGYGPGNGGESGTPAGTY
jgi:hypothetical protein